MRRRFPYLSAIKLAITKVAGSGIFAIFTLMNTQKRGFIGVGALIVILTGLVVIGGGAYYFEQQKLSVPTIPNNTDGTLPQTEAMGEQQTQNLQTSDNQQQSSKASETVSSKPETTSTPNQESIPTTQSNTFTVPSTFTISKGQTITQAGGNRVTVKYTKYIVNPYERVSPGQEYCVNSTLSYVGSVATELSAKGLTVPSDGEFGFTSCDPNTTSEPVSYNGLKISLAKFTSSGATYKVEFDPDSAQATINQSSLSSNSPSPTISGTAKNLKHVTVYIYKDPSSIDSTTIQIGDGVKNVPPIATTPAPNGIGYVDVVNGTWSTNFISWNDRSGNLVQLPDGVYKVNVAHPYSRYSLTTGTLTVKAN